MNHNYIFPHISDALPELLRDLLWTGEEVGSRNGRVKELTHVGITLERPAHREITVPGREANLAAQIAETAWVLAGRNDVEWLSNYMPRAKDYSDDGEVWRSGYGPRLRAWADHGNGKTIDQLAYVLDTLRADPLSRQAVAVLWDPVVDTEPGLDRACNNWLSFSSRFGALDLHVSVRSNDMMWGWSGINAFEWSSLQEIVAGLLGLNVGALHFSTTSLHLYDRHWEKTRQILSQSRPLAIASASPRFSLGGADRSLETFDTVLRMWFDLEKVIREGGPVGGYVENFPEPMLRSWLRVLQWWWSGDMEYLKPLHGTGLWYGAQAALQPKRLAYCLTAEGKQALEESKRSASRSFIDYVVSLHNEKHEAYGDSWKRRGEMLGIMANIARKVDRLGKNGAGETATDTAIDLAVYLAKYAVWLDAHASGSPHDVDPSDFPDEANEILRTWDGLELHERFDPDRAEGWLTDQFALLEKQVQVQNPDRRHRVGQMMKIAYALAKHLWEHESDQDDYRGADVD